MNILKKHIDFVLLFFIIGFFIGDFATSIAYKSFPGAFYRYAGLIKLCFEIIMVIIIISSKGKISKDYFIFFLLSVCFLINQFIGNQDEYLLKAEVLEGNIYFFNKYIYILIFIIFIKSISIKRETFTRIFNVFMYILVFNSILILIGFIFEIQLFKSYEYTDRFGYSGFFSKPEEASFMYMIAIIYHYYLWVRKKGNKELHKILFWVFFALLIGKKSILLFLILIILGHVIFIVKNRMLYRFIIPFVVLIFYFYKETVVNCVLELFPFWQDLYQKSGLITTLSSKRDILLAEAMSNVNLNWGFWNYIFGGIDISKYKVEFELVDLYLFLGVFGVAFYFYLISIHFLKRGNFLKKALLLAIFFTSFLSGGLILNVTSIIIFYITANYLMEDNELDKKTDKATHYSFFYVLYSNFAKVFDKTIK